MVVRYSERYSRSPRFRPEARCRDCDSVYNLRVVAGGYVCIDLEVCSLRQARDAELRELRESLEGAPQSEETS